MNRFWLVMMSLVLILAVVPLAACDDDDSETDIPERIISLAPSNTEVLFALGLGDRVVGVTEYCDYPEMAKGKQKVGGYSTVDMEKVIALDPDLVLAAAMHKDEVAPELERRGVRVVTLAPKTVEEVLQAISAVGVICGVDEQAGALVNSLRSRIDVVKETVASASTEQRPKVFYVTWHDPIWTLGSDTLTSEVIQLAGGVNIFADGDGNFETELETLVWRNPDIILASSGHGAAEDSPVYWAEEEERLGEVSARQSGMIYEVDADIMTRPGPRIVDGLELTARLIHPELFDQ